MKIAILGDTHFGVRGDSMVFHENFKQFYTEVFFPYLDKHNIDMVWQLGDLFDRRKYISFQSLTLCRKYFFDIMWENNIEFYTLIGNHDITYKNTLEVNSPDLLLKDYKNINIFKEPQSWICDIDVIPWICMDNEKEIAKFIKNSKASICLGHFELAGFEMDRGNVCHEGMSADILKRYEMVLSGHFHHKSTQGNITYVGTPSEHTWADYNDNKGFHVLDTDTKELEFIPNPHRMFYKVPYNDDNLLYDEVVNADYSHLASKYVKIVVEKRDNTFLFDTLMDQISKHNPAELSVVEDFTDYTETDVSEEVDQAEDTITILSKYVDGLTLPVESGIIKDILRDVYNEALSMETDSE
jgi:DNA repair exonuclease SbcCD nuclease subunit